MRKPFDPMAFGEPPADAVNDPDAMSQLLMANLPIFEDVRDTPRLDQGMLDVVGRVPYEPSGEGASSGLPAEPATRGGLDEEAMAQAILENARQTRDNSRAAQENARLSNEEEMAERAKLESGEMQ